MPMYAEIAPSIYERQTPQLFTGKTPLIHIHHDESTFLSNADQKCYWADGSTNVLKQESRTVNHGVRLHRRGWYRLSNEGMK